MSGWRLAVRELADRGGTLDIADFRTVDNANNHLQHLRRWGMVTGPKRGGGGPWVYTLTPKGWRLASGRLEPLNLTNQTGRGDPRHCATTSTVPRPHPSANPTTWLPKCGSCRFASPLSKLPRPTPSNTRVCLSRSETTCLQWALPSHGAFGPFSFARLEGQT